MRSTFSRLLSYCALALVSCLGFAGFASAADHVHAVAFKVRHMVAEVGHYGAESAKLQAQLDHMASGGEQLASRMGSLTPESNGFRLSAMTAVGFGEGLTGVGHGAPVA